MSIPAISHAISPEVNKSLSGLDFDLSQWDQNPRIGGLLSRTVLAGGKRLRPLLTLLMGDLFGADHGSMTPFARVVEMVHAATLAHDDVVDNADVRRGKPSINAVSCNKKAVLAGDYLLAYSLAEVARQGRPELVTCLSEIISDLAEGEWLQIENSKRTDLCRDHVDQVALKKTGSVLRWCSEVAPLYLGLDQTTVAKAREFGECLGIAFQMTDDILDFKRRDGAEFADLKNKVINSVIFETLALQGDQQTLNVRSLDELTLEEKSLKIALEVVAKNVAQRLQRCRDLLLEFSQRELDESQVKAQQQAFLTISCIIEYLANRV
ncbi:polyprenyl synthetase family protein [Pseudobacteriovorax antillogorgiicola]|uniref:Octaprenyl-diphosphate synthase n=1 Tax=Pseudobacteriovorax antillogorgiicola TaxID=1513793 RepID=A0A1Y6B6Y1_9BACT|nr:polyprenyl synthetase family protein [Pseudobacteriovorax antillogorgiicola]TCS58892.1 octaprenyl-diphosphate synthase [Pseudobacteriovorax antillogorgiicola]SME93536.1 octaprenyl-diphosphate synthase [Pseudobacteriovorax antillogorgiicola]